MSGWVCCVHAHLCVCVQWTTRGGGRKGKKKSGLNDDIDLIVGPGDTRTTQGGSSQGGSSQGGKRKQGGTNRAGMCVCN